MKLGRRSARSKLTARDSRGNRLSSGLREVNRANAEYAGLVRGLEYPAVLDRIRSPPVPLRLVLLGLLDALLFVAFRLPLHVLKRFGLESPGG